MAIVYNNMEDQYKKRHEYFKPQWHYREKNKEALEQNRDEYYENNKRQDQRTK